MPGSYNDFASELLRGAGEFIKKHEVRSKDIVLGSKVVRVIVPQEIDENGINILAGLIAANEVEYPDYELIFFSGRFDDFSPDTSIFKNEDMPLGQVRVELSYPSRVAFDIHTNTYVVYDPSAGNAVIWTEQPDTYPYWARATPFRLALSWIADSFDGEFLHGALLARDGKGIVLAGRSGAGKSTTAFVATSHGFELLSDDFFLFEENLMFPVYTRAKLHDSSLEILPTELRSKILNPDTESEKRIIDLDRERLSGYKDGIKVEYFLVPRKSSEAGVSAVGQGVILQHLAPYSLSGLLGGTSRSLLRIKRAISPGSSWILDISPRLEENPIALKRILESTP